MRGKEVISNWQYSAILIGFTLGTAIVYSFSMLYAFRDAFISEIIGSIGGLIFLLVTAFIIKKNPDMKFDKILDRNFSPIIGKILLSLIFMQALIIGTFSLKGIQSFMNLMVMQETPSWIFIISMIFVIAFIVRSGLEVFARCAELCIVLLISMLVFLIIIATPIIEIDNLLPVRVEGIQKIIKGIIATEGLPYFQLPLLVFIMSHIKNQENVYRTNIITFIFVSIILILRPVLIVGVFGPYAKEMVFPLYTLARVVTLGNFIERVELLLLGSWFLTLFIKLGVCLFSAAKCLQKIFNLKHYQGIIYPLAIFFIPISYKAYGTYQDTAIFIEVTGVLTDIIFLIIPISIVFFSLLIKRGKKTGG